MGRPSNPGHRDPHRVSWLRRPEEPRGPARVRRGDGDAEEQTTNRNMLAVAAAATAAATAAIADEHEDHHRRGAERVTIVDGKNSAAVNAKRELSVTDGRLSFDSAGNLKTAPQGAQTVSGTVGLSPTANTVKIDPQNAGRTALVLSLADPGGTPVPANGITRFLDVSPYGRIRVAAGNICTSPGSVVVDVRGNDGVGWIIDTYTLAPCDLKDQIYDLPGANISVAVFPSGGAGGNLTFLQVFGR
jgi:hypothetical protein